VRALGRARTGDLAGAHKAIARMQQLRDATKEARFDYFKRHLDLQMQAASAWIAHQEGKNDEAVATLRKAADDEDVLGKHPVSPGAFIPIREQLGTLFLELNRPKDAQLAFESALKIYPKRFRALYGAAQSADLNADKEKARAYYTQLAAQTANSDASREEVKRIRAYSNKVASVR
jgi:tetratricopeptide (TPR) repeat protein